VCSERGGVLKKTTERAVVFIVGVALLLLILAIVVWGPAQNSGIAYVAVRTVLGLAAAGFVVFVPGFLEFNWNPVVKAGGAIAAFAIVFFVNPPEAPGIIKPPAFTHVGYLGNLHDHLQNSRADAGFLFTLNDKWNQELRWFWVAPEVGADTPADLLKKICRRYSSCLVCNPPADQLTTHVEVAWRQTPIMTAAAAAGSAPRYACASPGIATSTQTAPTR
jgi:hypothetical protein